MINVDLITVEQDDNARNLKINIPREYFLNCDGWATVRAYLKAYEASPYRLARIQDEMRQLFSLVERRGQLIDMTEKTAVGGRIFAGETADGQG